MTLVLAAEMLVLPVFVAQSSPFGDAAKVSDAELAGMRGGIRLPDGLEVQVGIDIATRVDGELALRTVLTSESPTVRVFTGDPGSGSGAGGSGDGGATGQSVVPGSAGMVNAPTVQFSRDGAGTVIEWSAVALPQVAVTTGRGDAATDAPGQRELALTPGGPAVQTALGAVRLVQDGRGTVADLQGANLLLQQYVGAATGVVVANTANDRAIDTVTTINVDLMNANPALANAALAIQQVALDAAGRDNY